MKKVFRTVSLILAGIMLVLSIAGCGKNEEENTAVSILEDPNVTAPGELPIVKEKITLTVGVYSDTNITDYETNAYSKFLEEKTGIDLEFIPILNPAQKIKIMLAADDENLPDVIMGCGFTDDVFMKYGINGTGAIIDLNEYMDNYGYYFNEAMLKAQDPTMEKRLYTADGARYYMPKIVEQTGNNYPAKAIINKVWLDKLGLEVPKTTEDLKKVLTAFVNDDPNGNGKKDELGITGAFNSWFSIPWHFLVNAFIYDDFTTQMIINDQDKVESILYKDEFKQALEYINDLCVNGLYDTQAFTQNEDTLRTIALQEDNTIGIFVGGSPDAVFRNNPERMHDYVALPPIEGPNGVAYTLYSDDSIAAYGFITKYCEHPLAAFRLMDFMMSEEASTFSRFGVEGTDWRPAGEGDISMFESIGATPKLVSILGYGTVQNSHWQERNPGFRSKELSDGMAWDGNPNNGEKFKGDLLSAYYGKQVPEKRFVAPSYTIEEIEEMASLWTEIKLQIDQELPKFIMGTRPLVEYDAFLEEITGMGMDRYIEICQSGYDKKFK